MESDGLETMGAYRSGQAGHIFDTQKEIVIEPEKQVAFSNEKCEPEFAGLEVQGAYAQNQDKYVADAAGKDASDRKSRTRLRVGGVVIGLVVIVAVIVGSVLGSKHLKDKMIGDAAPSAVSPPSSSLAPWSSAPISVTTTSMRLPLETQLPAKVGNRKIAGLSYLEKSLPSTRLFYQDNAGYLWEARTLEGTSNWTIAAIGVEAKMGSPIAAAVSRPGFPLEISLYYLNSSNIIHDQLWNTTSEGWNPGTLASQGYTAGQNTSLTAMFNQCAMCANTTLLAFQAPDLDVQFCNFTSSGWQISSLGLTAAEGSGLSIAPFHYSWLKDQINLYYQRKTDGWLTLASLVPASLNNGVEAWALEYRAYHSLPDSTPIVAASSYTNSPNSVFQTWLQILSIAGAGVAVDTWSGAANAWLVHDFQPPIMSTNGTRELRQYNYLAITSLGDAFAVTSTPGQKDSINRWRVADDMLTWSSAGNVNIGDAWS